jgi:hydroxymethylglutaryl-CoA lyase
VMAGITRRPGVRYAVLTPNLRGLQAALAARADEVAIFAYASEGFSQHNINCSIAESLQRYGVVTEAAARQGVPVRAYVSCVCDCPYDGPTPPDAVADVAARLLALGAVEISLGDTIGSGTPRKVRAMLAAVLERIPASRLAGHFHDTGGRALDNIQTALDQGLRIFDASAGGLGGCPFAPGAKGNVATEAVAAMLTLDGFAHGIDTGRLRKAAAFARSLRGRS